MPPGTPSFFLLLLCPGPPHFPSQDLGIRAAGSSYTWPSCEPLPILGPQFLCAEECTAKMNLRNQGTRDFCSEMEQPLPTPATHPPPFVSPPWCPLTPPPPAPEPPAYSSACSAPIPGAGEAGQGSLPQATARRPLPHPSAQWAGEGTELHAWMPPPTGTRLAGRGGGRHPGALVRCCEHRLGLIWVSLYSASPAPL